MSRTKVCAAAFSYFPAADRLSGLKARADTDGAFASAMAQASAVRAGFRVVSFLKKL